MEIVTKIPLALLVIMMNNDNSINNNSNSNNNIRGKADNTRRKDT